MSHKPRVITGVQLQLPNGEKRFLPSADCMRTMAKIANRDMYDVLKDLQKVNSNSDIIIRFK